MNIKDIITKVAIDLNIPEEVAILAYRSYWKFIRETIETLPLKEDLSEEEFKSLRTNFNLPSLGKLYLTYDKYVSLKKRYEYVKKIKEKNESNTTDS